MRWAFIVAALALVLGVTGIFGGGSVSDYIPDKSAGADNPATTPATHPLTEPATIPADATTAAAETAAAAPSTEQTKPPEKTSETAGSGRKMVALTFDDGPSGKVTPAILDMLEKHGARATFFCLGNRAATYADTLKRMVALNCEIASHSYEHKHLVKLSPNQLSEDLKKANDALEKHSGQRPRLLRTPYGENTHELMKKIDAPVILWSIDTRDWCYHVRPNETRTEEEIERDCLKVLNKTLAEIKDGDIVLMHDLYGTTQRIAVELIETLVNDGWELVTVSELFEAKGIELKGQTYYRSAK